MSEITKLYENANIEKEVIKGCYDYYSKLGIDIWKENDCRGKNCDTCKKDKSIKEYPPFTAEKQLNIVKFLFNQGVYYSTFPNDTYQFHISDDIENPQPRKFDIAIAEIINDLWQDLTEEEKQQIKEILK